MEPVRKTLKPRRRENKDASLPAKFSPRFWDHCDSRLAVVRNIRSRYNLLRDACGGHESPQRDLLVQRIAFLAILIETSEVIAAEGGHIDVGIYVQSLNAFTGLIKTVGLEKRVKNVTDLKAYLDSRERKAG